jgi:hypothetical protein
MRDRIFEPFVTGKVGGTGLGLPVVHRAVEAHRGIVLVDALEKGTRFTVLLPVSIGAVRFDDALDTPSTDETLLFTYREESQTETMIRSPGAPV